jgi:hypothetical protein
MIFPHPGSWISDPGSRIQKQQQKRGVKKNLLSYLFFSHKFHNIVNYYIFEMLNKKMWLNFQRITERLPKKLSQSFKNMGLGSGIRNKPIPDPDPGSMGQKGTGSRIPDPGSATLRIGTVRGRLLPVPRREEINIKDGVKTLRLSH